MNPNLIKKLQVWCKEQKSPRFRLKVEKGLGNEQIDQLPKSLISKAKFLPDTYRPEDFNIPAGYREFINKYGGMRLEYLGSL